MSLVEGPGLGGLTAAYLPGRAEPRGIVYGDNT